MLPSSRPDAAIRTDERAAALALLPIAATIDYYALPDWLQQRPLIQFAPQVIGYLAFALWATHNHPVLQRVGLEMPLWRRGAKLGVVTGLVLGCVNSLVILRVLPDRGWDITFLTDTPHAHVPVLIMVPWFISVIAVAVEVNFRGFLLGRLAALESTIWRWTPLRRVTPVAVLASAVVFAFDPFMVSTFRDLHWIALWDGLCWALIWVCTRNLYATIVAHAIEVIVVYSAVRAVLMT